MLINKTPTYAHAVNSGVVFEYEFDLATEKPQGFIGASMLGFNKASVTIQSIGATGTSGNAPVLQSNTTSVADGAAPAGNPSLAIAANTTVNAFGIDVTGMFLLVNLKNITFGDVGKIKVIIVAKR